MGMQGSRQRDEAMPAAVDEPERHDQNDRRPGRGAVEEQHLDILLEVVTTTRFEQVAIGDRGQNQRSHAERERARIDGSDPIQPRPPLHTAECPPRCRSGCVAD